MEWINLHIRILDSAEFVGEEPVNQATWLKLLRYCCGQENGGRIVGCRAWKDRKWQQLIRVTLKEATTESELWAWEGDDLKLAFYPLEKEQEIQAKREIARTNGNQGGRPRRTREKTDVGSQKKPTLVNFAKAEGKGREGKENGKEGNANCAAQNLATIIDEIRQAYPRRTHVRDTAEQVAAAIRRHDGPPEDILEGTRAIAAAVAGWTDNERLQFLKTPPDFFAGDHWQDDPAYWASRRQARLDNSKQTPTPDIGGRRPAGVASITKP
jgi:hypothetical protein